MYNTAVKTLLNPINSRQYSNLYEWALCKSAINLVLLLAFTIMFYNIHAHIPTEELICVFPCLQTRQTQNEVEAVS